MPGYLDEYGVEEARRGRLIKRLVLAAVLLAIIAGALYLGLRTHAARKQVTLFLQYLRAGDYKSAYALWGCTEATPCRDYNYDRFMEDWGPKSPHADAAAAVIKEMPARTCGPGVFATLISIAAHALGERGCDCGSGVILTVSFPKGEDVVLWYERKDKTLGFAPWPACVAAPKGFQ